MCPCSLADPIAFLIVEPVLATSAFGPDLCFHSEAMCFSCRDLLQQRSVPFIAEPSLGKHSSTTLQTNILDCALTRASTSNERCNNEISHALVAVLLISETLFAGVANAIALNKNILCSLAFRNVLQHFMELFELLLPTCIPIIVFNYSPVLSQDPEVKLIMNRRQTNERPETGANAKT